MSATTDAIWPFSATIAAIDHRDSPGITTTCTYLLFTSTEAAVELSLADEIDEKPAAITTDNDNDKTVLANRLACLAFMIYS